MTIVIMEAQGEYSVLPRISDNGMGFDRDQVPAGHIGLGTMHQRVIEMRGEYLVESARGEGNCVMVRIPLHNWRL